MYGDIEHYVMHKLQHGKRSALDGISRAKRVRRRTEPVKRVESKKTVTETTSSPRGRTSASRRA